MTTFLVHFSLAIEGLQTIEGKQSKTPEGNTGSLGVTMNSSIWRNLDGKRKSKQILNISTQRNERSFTKMLAKPLHL